MTQQLDVTPDVSTTPFQYDFGGDMHLNVLVVNLSLTDTIALNYGPSEAPVTANRQDAAPGSHVLLRSAIVRFLQVSDVTNPPASPCGVRIIAAWPEATEYDDTSSTLTQNEAIIKSVTNNVPTSLQVDGVGLAKAAQLPGALDGSGNLKIRTLSTADTPAHQVFDGAAYHPLFSDASGRPRHVLDADNVGLLKDSKVPSPLKQGSDGSMVLGLSGGAAIDPRSIRALTSADQMTPLGSGGSALQQDGSGNLKHALMADNVGLAKTGQLPAVLDASGGLKHALIADNVGLAKTGQLPGALTASGNLKLAHQEDNIGLSKDATVALPNSMAANMEEAGSSPQLGGTAANQRNYNPWGFTTGAPTLTAFVGDNTQFTANVQRSGARGYLLFNVYVPAHTAAGTITIFLYRKLPIEGPNAVPDAQFSIVTAASQPGSWIAVAPNIWWPYDTLVIIPQQTAGAAYGGAIPEVALCQSLPVSARDAHTWASSVWSTVSFNVGHGTSDAVAAIWWTVMTAAPSALPVTVVGGEITVQVPVRVLATGAMDQTIAATTRVDWFKTQASPLIAGVDCVIEYALACPATNNGNYCALSFKIPGAGSWSTIKAYGSAGQGPLVGRIHVPAGTLIWCDALNSTAGGLLYSASVQILDVIP